MEKDWFDKALKHQEDNNYCQALFAITKYILENPDNKNGKLLKAVICRDLANYKVSLEILNGIIPVEEDSEKYKRVYYREMAETFQGMGNYEEAQTWYDKYISLTPSETQGYIFKGSCLALAGQFDLAKEQHLIATKLRGDPEEAFYNLALIYRAEMNFKEAKICCEKSLEIDPNDKDVKLCLDDIVETINLIEKHGS